MTTTFNMSVENKPAGSLEVTHVLLPLSGGEIRLDGGTQSRIEVHQATVDEYADAIRAGAVMPRVVVFDDKEHLWLADGFHRYHAHLVAEATEIDCEVHEGSLRDAILYSLHANANHGLRRSNKDKRKAVQTLLDDAEWSTWSNITIAKACGVSDHFVGSMRKPISDPIGDSAASRRKVTRKGKIYEQCTANIGRAQKPSAELNVETAAMEQPMASEEDIAADGMLELENRNGDAFNPQCAELIEKNAALERRVAKLKKQLIMMQQERNKFEEQLVTAEQVQAELRGKMAEMANDSAEMANDAQSTADDNEIMRKVFESDDRIGAALAQVKQLQDLNRVMQTRIDGLMNEKVEVLRRFKATKRDLEKLQKAPVHVV